tara:strand:- start:868 stop:1026 length:159 start_codon:yes stop_codon:yes gene_type:complete
MAEIDHAPARRIGAILRRMDKGEIDVGEAKRLIQEEDQRMPWVDRFLHVLLR